MRQAIHTLEIQTRGQALYDLTARVRTWTKQQAAGGPAIATGLLTLWCQHTSASLTVGENTDPAVQADLLDFFKRLVPETAPYRHAAEGPDDMPAHIRSALTQTSLSVPVQHGMPLLGTWQAIYLIEHRAAPHARRVSLHLIGS